MANEDFVNINPLGKAEGVQAQPVPKNVDPATLLQGAGTSNFDLQSNLPNDPNLDAQITQATIMNGLGGPSAADQAAVDALVQAQIPGVEIGDPGVQSLFPGLNQPINVGTQSGSIIGNNPIFVRSGGVAPVGVVQARKKALEDAAKAKAKALKPFEMPKGPITKDPRFQDKLNSIVTNGQEDFIQKAQDQFGEEGFVALQSPNTKIGREFIRFMENAEVLAREGDQISDLMAEIDSGVETGDLVFSDKTLALRDEYDKLVGAFEEGDISKIKDLGGRLNELRGFVGMDKVFNDQGIVDDIKGRLVERAGVGNFEEYLTARKSGTKTFDQDAETIAAELAKGTFRAQVRAGLFNEGDIATALKARLGSERTASVSITTKRKKSGSGFDVDPDKITVDDDREVDITPTTGDRGAEGVALNNNIKVPNFFPLGKGGKAVQLTGAKVLDPSGEDFNLQAGSASYKPIAISQAKIKQKDGSFKTENVLHATVEVEVPVLDDKGEIVTDSKTGVVKTKKEEQTKLIDLNSVPADIKQMAPNVFGAFEKRTGSTGARSSSSSSGGKKTVGGF